MKRHTGRLLARRWLDADTFELTLSRPAHFDFAAGQRLDLYLGDAVRAYSLVSAPFEPQLTLCIARVAHGRVSPHLAEVKLDATLHFSGPFGYFLFHPSRHPAVFVATGTGIAPFVCMVRAGIRNVTLLHGAADADRAHYGQWLAGRVANYRACLSSPRVEKPALPAFRGRVTDYIERHLSGQNYDFYICGRPAMVRDVVGIIDRRFPEARVRMEIFG